MIVTNSKGDQYRSFDSGTLHKLIGAYCFECPTSERAEIALKAINEFLYPSNEEDLRSPLRQRKKPNVTPTKRPPRPPEFILDIPEVPGQASERFSHLDDALHLPFSRSVSEINGINPYALRKEKAATLFDCLTDFIHTAMASGKISERDYSGLLSHANRQSRSLLRSAISSGDVDLARKVFAEVESHVPADTFKHLLRQSNKDNWNLFHAATHKDADKYMPSKGMIEILIGQFKKTFGEEEAMAEIAALCAKRNTRGFTPLAEEKGGWVRELLKDYATPPDRNGFRCL